MQCALSKIQCVGNPGTSFNIQLSNHNKDVSNQKSIPADLHFRKPGHSYNLYAKLFEQLSNIHVINKTP